jgi:hypothetical protein
VTATLALFIALAAKSTMTGPTGPQGKEGPRGATGDQGPKGDKGDPGIPATDLWAQVGSTGTLVKGSGVMNVEEMSNGFYSVQFERDISDCTSLGSTAFSQGEITTEISGSPTSDVFIETYNSKGETREGRTFALAVFC